MVVRRVTMRIIVKGELGEGEGPLRNVQVISVGKEFSLDES